MSDDEEGSVRVPIYSRLEFPAEDAVDIHAALEAVRARLGPDAALADIVDCGSGRGVAIRSAHDVVGRSRLPMGTKAAPQDEWRGYFVLPPSTPGGDAVEVPIGEIDMPLREIVALGGHALIVIPLTFSLGVGASAGPHPQAKA